MEGKGTTSVKTKEHRGRVTLCMGTRFFVSARRLVDSRILGHSGLAPEGCNRMMIDNIMHTTTMGFGRNWGSTRMLDRRYSELFSRSSVKDGDSCDSL